VAHVCWTPCSSRWAAPGGARNVALTAEAESTLLAGGIVMALSSSSLLLGPTVLSPYPAMMLIPTFEVGWVAAALPPIVFWLWCFQLFRGEPLVPLRSAVMLAVLSLLTPAYFIARWDDGLQFDGLFWVLGVAFINALMIGWLWKLLYHARKSASFHASLLFHGVLFAWLAWSAFPNLGELP